MHRINPDIDIIKDLLQAVIKAQPASVFANSLLQQYQERGGLSKKQLEGLHSKATKISGVPEGKLATLQAIILKRPNRYKSEAAVINHAEVADDATIYDIESILKVSPAHKRVLYLKNKYDNKETLSAADITEIARFKKLLVK